MSADEANDCTEMVGEPPGYWHEHRCTRRATWLVRDIRTTLPRGVCTQHRKWHDRWGEVIGPIDDGEAMS